MQTTKVTNVRLATFREIPIVSTLQLSYVQPPKYSPTTKESGFSTFEISLQLLFTGLAHTPYFSLLFSTPKKMTSKGLTADPKQMWHFAKKKLPFF